MVRPDGAKRKLVQDVGGKVGVQKSFTSCFDKRSHPVFTAWGKKWMEADGLDLNQVCQKQNPQFQSEVLVLQLGSLGHKYAWLPVTTSAEELKNRASMFGDCKP